MLHTVCWEKHSHWCTLFFFSNMAKEEYFVQCVLYAVQLNLYLS